MARAALIPSPRQVVHVIDDRGSLVDDTLASHFSQRVDLMAVVPISAITAVSGCSGATPEGDEEVSNETAQLTNNGAADPGPRAGAAGAGAPLVTQPFDQDSATQQAQVGVACMPGLSSPMQHLCEQAILRFQEIDSIAGATVSTGLQGFIPAGTVGTGTGVGPAYNAVGCAVCHSQPGVMGSGVAPSSPQFLGAPARVPARSARGPARVRSAGCAPATASWI